MGQRLSLIRLFCNKLQKIHLPLWEGYSPGKNLKPFRLLPCGQNPPPLSGEARLRADDIRPYGWQRRFFAAILR